LSKVSKGAASKVFFPQYFQISNTFLILQYSFLAVLTQVEQQPVILVELANTMISLEKLLKLAVKAAA